jgi:hypothetical protein
LDNGAGDIALRNSDQAVTEQEPGLQFIDPQIGATERHVCLKAWPSAADARIGPAPLAHRSLLSRCMRYVQWLARCQRERINILQPAPFTI